MPTVLVEKCPGCTGEIRINVTDDRIVSANHSEPACPAFVEKLPSTIKAWEAAGLKTFRLVN